MKTPTDVLRDEHVVILRALDALERAAARLMGGGAVPESWWDEIGDWLRDFADRNHHAKEEQSLFPAMVKFGVPSEGDPSGSCWKSTSAAVR
jgi:hemerythrin-like domain-containing protein